MKVVWWPDYVVWDSFSNKVLYAGKGKVPKGLVYKVANVLGIWVSRYEVRKPKVYVDDYVWEVGSRRFYVIVRRVRKKGRNEIDFRNVRIDWRSEEVDLLYGAKRIDDVTELFMKVWQDVSRKERDVHVWWSRMLIRVDKGNMVEEYFVKDKEGQDVKFWVKRGDVNNMNSGVSFSVDVYYRGRLVDSRWVNWNAVLGGRNFYEKVEGEYLLGLKDMGRVEMDVGEFYRVIDDMTVVNRWNLDYKYMVSSRLVVDKYKRNVENKMNVVMISDGKWMLFKMFWKWYTIGENFRNWLWKFRRWLIFRGGVAELRGLLDPGS